MTGRGVLVLALLAMPALPARAVEAYALEGLLLLQPEQVLRERVIDGAAAMTDYVRAIGTAADQVISAAPQPQRATSGYIVLAVRPGGRSKVWLDLWPRLPARTEQELTAALGKVPPFAVARGSVVFALSISTWGAAPTTQSQPRPDEWTRALRELGGPAHSEAVVDAVWPAPASTAH